MKEYIIYFARNKDYLSANKYEFEYKVNALEEGEAKRKAIALFHKNNPTQKLEDYTYGFLKN